MNWKTLQTSEQLNELLELSGTRPQVIFKHSTRCSISKVAMTRLEKAAAPEEMDFHYLDLITYRSLSNEIAERLGVVHESPQVLLIRDGQPVYTESHMGITMDDIKAEGLK